MAALLRCEHGRSRRKNNNSLNDTNPMFRKICFQDLKEDVQMDIYDEVRSFLLWTDAVAPRSEEESYEAFEHRIHEQVDAYLNNHNNCIEILCQTND